MILPMVRVELIGASVDAIAARAGVSLMTVSKALRDQPDVSATTKTRVKLLAQQMGYLPDSSAQGFENGLRPFGGRTSRSKVLGIGSLSLGVNTLNQLTFDSYSIRPSAFSTSFRR